MTAKTKNKMKKKILFLANECTFKFQPRHTYPYACAHIDQTTFSIKSAFIELLCLGFWLLNFKRSSEELYLMNSASSILIFYHWVELH